jgi:hypothetical protein
MLFSGLLKVRRLHGLKIFMGHFSLELWNYKAALLSFITCLWLRWVKVKAHALLISHWWFLRACVKAWLRILRWLGSSHRTGNTLSNTNPGGQVRGDRPGAEPQGCPFCSSLTMNEGRISLTQKACNVQHLPIKLNLGQKFITTNAHKEQWQSGLWYTPVVLAAREIEAGGL